VERKAGDEGVREVVGDEGTRCDGGIGVGGDERIEGDKGVKGVKDDGSESGWRAKGREAGSVKEFRRTEPEPEDAVCRRGMTPSAVCVFHFPPSPLLLLVAAIISAAHKVTAPHTRYAHLAHQYFVY
jgi:hypothetical protein